MILPATSDENRAILESMGDSLSVSLASSKKPSSSCGVVGISILRILVQVTAPKPLQLSR